jgi:hypothetical protein
VKSSKALKEWASTCQSFLESEPLLLLRKGGVGDAGLERPDGPFWLVPTWLHQQEQGLRPEARGLLERSAGLKSPPGSLHLNLAAQLCASWEVTDPLLLPALETHHAMTPETVLKRFHYRQPGLNAWLLRVWQTQTPVSMLWNPAWDGCVSWMNLDSVIEVPAGTNPIADESKLASMYHRLAALLGAPQIGPCAAGGVTLP